MRRILLLLSVAFLVPLTSAHAALRTEHITYHAGKTVLKGYLVYDNRFKGRRPGILVVHEWWGQTSYERHRANMLAKLGYTAFAVDMYGNGKVANTPKLAEEYSGAVEKDRAAERARFMAAYKILHRQPTVNSSEMGAIGYCFGGGVVLDMARQGAPLKGVVSFHGTLGSVEPALPGKVKAKVLVLTGGADPFNPPKTVKAFEASMKAAGAHFRVVSYPGALHAFTNPKATELGKKFHLPIAYDASADHKSWAQMKTFFSDLFKAKAKA